MNVTIKDIAYVSDVSVQTVYNLVGPREQAISDAITEYILYLGSGGSRVQADPTAADVINRWIDASAVRPEFSRQCNLVYFTPCRSIYYRFRDAQTRAIIPWLKRQRLLGKVRNDLSALEMAEETIFFAGALWSEWADRPFPLEVLRRKLVSGTHKLLGEA